MSWHTRRDLRKIHRWGGALIALPFLLVLITGLILQVKKEVDWVQPPSQTGVSAVPTISFDDILSASKTVPEAMIQSWKDIDRLDVRPDKGIVKVRANNRWEIQIDTETSEILQVAYRRSELLESLHDGSWFHNSAKLWVFLPSGLVVTILWITGIYLFFTPYFAKRKNRKQLEKRKKKAKS
ncbi:MAG: PepSY domain-containing protein [Gracilimonas sp.]|uniref:PepSY-associated TM helix domain-containing protein n=1 Tax=Gracilimonas sp. TaxID=1974203 RepID=UPI0019C40077|nr:PepSY-associated TM helix domain-containing protein [Gracilimonas sp.]MBD3615256.1 PepSY domain-containing protein [Gracilimonas sp.]